MFWSTIGVPMVLQKYIVGELGKPRLESARRAKSSELVPGADKRFLTEVFRKCMVSHQATLQEQYSWLVTAHELFEGGNVTEVQRLDYQRFITRLHFSAPFRVPSVWCKTTNPYTRSRPGRERSK